jgi:hypothetical protein
LMVMTGTGLGPVVEADEAGPDFLKEVDFGAEVLVGGKPASVVAQVRVTRGDDFILFKLPDDVAQGCYVPLAVRAGGTLSNVASISVSGSGDSCSDPAGFSASDLDGVQKSGGINIGVIQFNRFDFRGEIIGEANGKFVRYHQDDLRGSYAALSTGNGIRNALFVPPFGTCTVHTGSTSIPTDQTEVQQRHNVGQALNLSGPNGKAEMAAPDYQFEARNDFFTPGDYTIDNGTGTSTFGPFKGAITLPRPIEWTNRGEIQTVDRKEDLKVTWAGGAENQEFVMIVGFSQDDTDWGFLCTERVTAGKFTVPASVIAGFPVSAPSGIIGLGTAPLTGAGRFSAPGLDIGLFTYEQATFAVIPLR